MSFNHQQFLQLKLERRLRKDPKEPAFCDTVTDTDLWLLAGVTELLAAASLDPALLAISEEERGTWRSYLQTGTSLIQSRLKTTALRNRAGQPVEGLAFDPGAWDGHPDYDFSGYTGEPYPNPKDRRAAKGLSWDISHARRFVHVFTSLLANQQITGSSFPDRQTLVKLANQYAYGIFNGDFRHPLFTNYFDGHNGWYRVGYQGRSGFGDGPYQQSIAGMTAGYGFWKKYNPDIEAVNQALWTMLNASDAETRTHRAKYYSALEKTPGTTLIQFLPVFVNNVH